MKRTALAFLLVPLVSIPSIASAKAPFGLTWGMSKADVESLGVSLSPANKDGSLDEYRTTSLPVDLSNAEFYSLVFAKGYGLQKISMASDTISGDVYGREGRAAYDRLKTSLIEKYGSTPEEFEYTGRELWKEPDEFYQCLNYAGCGDWISFFDIEEEGQLIGLALRGLGRGKGYLTLGYDGPEWNDVIEAQEAITASQDSGAL